jgi:diguanylate cyclase (GGDEF)-like protein
MSALTRYLTAVSALGLALVGAVIALAGGHLLGFGGTEDWTLAVCLIVGECCPMRIVHDGSEGEITTSSTFAMALLIAAGAPAAIIGLCLGALVADLIKRKPLYRAVFNIGQYALTMGAAAVAFSVTSGVPLGSAAPLTPERLPACIAAAAVFFVVNAALVARAVCLSEGVEFWGYLRRDLAVQTSTVGILLGLGPIVVITTDFSPIALPLLGLPLLAVRRAGRQSVASQREALHDALTGLPNRALFHDRIEQTRRLAAREDGRFTVMLLDLDRFKEINDTLGHAHGDLLLRGLSERLSATLRETDTVARLGGDEFAIVLPGVGTPEAAVEVAAKLRSVIEEPFQSEGMVLEVGGSVGIAIYPEDGQDSETLLRHADVAMYQAKEGNLGQQVYVPDRDPHSTEKLRMLGELRRAHEHGELVPYFQPKVGVADGRVEGLEALVRWRHPRRGLLLPSEFVPLAERTGHVGALTRLVLDGSLAEARRALDEGRDMRVAVNLSARSLLDERILHDVDAALQRWDVPGELLQLELTESMLVADPRRARQVLDCLRAMGIGLSLDDFGTGYSSLAHLTDLPVDELKVDRSFVARLDSDSAAAAIVTSTVGLAHDLGLRVVAEGVESQVVYERLQSLGVDAVQGYLFGRPVPPEQLRGALLRAERAQVAARPAHRAA